jgi:hypothetical protein
MTILNYKPLALEAENIPTGPFQNDFPLGAAIPNRYINNSQFIAQNRLRRGCKTWDACRTFSNTGNPPVSPAALEGNNLIGHLGNFAGSAAQTVPYTEGLQFSTHPAVPLGIPFLFPVSPGARFIDVYISAQIDNAAGGIMAEGFFQDSGGMRPMAQQCSVELLNFTNFAAPVMNSGTATDFFTSGIRASTQYQEAQPTATAGFNGMSYFKVTIPLSDRLEGLQIKRMDTQPVMSSIILSFQSGIDFGSLVTRATANQPLRLGNREVTMNDNFSKFAGSLDPGAYHKVFKFSYPLTDRIESWHHALAAYPEDLSVSAYSSSGREKMLIWPGIPANDVEQGSADPVSNSTAPDGSGFSQGDNVEEYDITVFKLYSVSIEERYS